MKLQKEFRSYLTSLNAGYPSFMKPSAGFYAAELLDKAQRNDNSTSKVRTLWKKFAKKTYKVGGENKVTGIPSLGYMERIISEKLSAYQDSAPSTSISKNAPPAESLRRSIEDNLDTGSPRLNYSGSQSQASAISDADTDERFGIDEGTLCWNLLVSRLFFDSQSNPAMKKAIQARIQVYCL